MIAHVAGKHHIAGVPALRGGNDGSGAGFRRRQFPLTGSNRAPRSQLPQAADF